MGQPARSSPAPSAAQRRVPDFFIVGAPKCGTTALYRMLRQHPRIFMPDLKEPRFLATDVQSRFQAADERERISYPRTLEQYLELFAPAREEQLAGEATTLYLWSPTAAARIAQLSPHARIIAIVREPASLLRSLHLTFVRGGVESETDLRSAISLEGERRQGRRLPPSSRRPWLLQYSEHVRYVEQLRRYHAAFAPERVLVLIYDDFRDDNAATLKRVLRFLEVEDEHPIAVIDTNVTTRIVRSWPLKRAMRSVTMGEGSLARVAKAAIKTLTPARVRRHAFRVVDARVVNRRPPPPDERLMLELRRRYKPEVVALSEYLGRDLVALWGYADL